MRILKLAVRQLAAAPGVSVPAVLMLALGLGACTAIFTVVDAVLLRPLAFPDPDRLVVIRETNPQFEDFSVAPGQLYEWRQRAKAFERLAATRTGSYTLTGGGEAIRVNAEQVTANYLRTLGVTPAIGRDFADEEDAPGHDGVAMLSHGFWVRHFGGRTNVVNAHIVLDRRPVTIVGVLPASFRRGAEFDLLTPLALSTAERGDHGNHHLDALGRLKRHVSIEEATSELAVIAKSLAAANPATNEDWGARLIPMLEHTVGSVRPALLAGSVAVGFLLLIVIVNVANLLLARAPDRRKEMGIRISLGAAPGTIVRQLLAESVLLALAGGALGIVLAQWSTSALVALMPEALPRAEEIDLSWRVLLFGSALGLIVGVGFGLVPAIQSSVVNPGEALNEAGRATMTHARGWRVRRALVIAQLVLALMLLTSAGLTMRSFARLLEVSPGFNPDDAVSVAFRLSADRYAEQAARTAFVEQLMDRLEAVPGVSSAGATHVLPFSGYDFVNGFFIEGRPRPSQSELPDTNYYAVTPEYFRAMQIPLIRGRFFTRSDTRAGRRVVIINESMAARMFPGDDPIGKRINVTNQPDTVWREIVGVVGDVRHYRLDADPTPQTYEPFAQEPFASFTVVVRTTSGAAPGLDAAFRTIVHALDPGEGVATSRPLRELVATSLARQQFTATLFGIFSGCALLLTAIGMYAVMSFAVAQRRGEFAIRLAVGARPREVLRLVLADGARLMGVGALIGLAGALASARLVRRLLFETSPQDPLTLLAMTVLLVGVTTIACLVPAIRATRLDPIVALRDS